MANVGPTKVAARRWAVAALLAFTIGAATAWAHSPRGRRNLNAELIAAARDGNGTEVRFLLALGADPNARDRDGDTALIAAAYAPARPGPIVMRSINGHGSCGQESIPAAYGEIVHALMCSGADPMLENRQGLTAIARAQEIRAYDYLPELTAGIRGRSKGYVR